MASYVKLEFIKQHRWVKPAYFNVYHSDGDYLRYPFECISGNEPLWQHRWEQAGFAYGRFGYGSFGWAQGGCVNGGFGYGRFGKGEFGYYNEVVQWTSAIKYSDGMHSFGIELYNEYGQSGTLIAETSILVISEPERPRQLLFKGMEGGKLVLESY